MMARGEWEIPPCRLRNNDSTLNFTANDNTNHKHIMLDTSKKPESSKPAAMAIPKGGFFKDKVEQGRYGPIFPKTPACYGFTIIAKIKPGREETVRSYGNKIEETIAG